MSFTGPKVNLNSSLLGTTAISLALDHIDSNGSSHTFINQDVTTSATPKFSGMNACSNVIVNVADPVNAQDAATRGFVLGFTGNNITTVGTITSGTWAANITVDAISELTGGSGVNVDGVLLQDANVIATDGIFTNLVTGSLSITSANIPTLNVDTILESTGGAGVSVDGVTFENSNLVANNVTITSLTATTLTTDTANAASITVDLITESVTSNGVTISNLQIPAGPSGTPITYVSTVTQFTDAISAGRGYIKIAPGIYPITATVTVSANTVLEGSGKSVTTFQKTSGVFPVFTTGGNNVTFKELSMDDNGVTGGHLLFIDNSRDINVIDCQFDVNSGFGIIDMDNGCDNIMVRGCLFKTGSTGASNCVDMTSTNNVIISDCIFDINRTGSFIETLTCNKVLISGCRFGSTFVSQRGVRISGGSDIQFVDNYMQGTSTRGSVILNSAAQHVTIKGNIMEVWEVGVGTTASTTINNVTVTGNMFKEILEGGVSQEAEGNDDGTWNNWQISDNKFINSANVTNHAVFISKGNNHVIADNQFVGDTIQWIELSSARVSHALIQGNIGTSTGNSNVIVVTAGDFAQVGQNSLVRELTLTGSLTVNGYHDRLIVDADSRTGDTLTLDDLTQGSVGHKLYVELTANAGDFTLSPTSTHTDFATAGATGTFSTITFNSNGDFATLEWQGNGWNILTGSGVVIA